jgi:hypothetical protein
VVFLDVARLLSTSDRLALERASGDKAGEAARDG